MGLIDWQGRLEKNPDWPALREQGVLGSRTIAQELREIADRFGDNDALVTSEGRRTYRELDIRTDQIAAALIALGLQRGERVLVQVSNRLAVVEAWYGLLKAGLIPVCTLAAHRGHEVDGIAERTQAVGHLVEAGLGSFDLVAFAQERAASHATLRVLLTVGAPSDAPGNRIEDLGAEIDPAAARAQVAEVQAEIDPDEVAVFQLSGGTTGVPKVIPRMHAEYWVNARAYAEALGFDDTARIGHLIPIVHNAGVVCGLHAAHSVGGCLVLAGPDFAAVQPLLATERITDTLIGPGHYGSVTTEGFTELAGALRTVILSGAKVPVPTFERLEELGVWSGQLFGMGEGFFSLTSRSAPREARLTTVGTPLLAADEFRVVAPGTEDEVPDGEAGELLCRGPYTLRGYFDAATQNAAAFTADGFFHTGDLVSVREIDGERNLCIEGRIKDVINRGGEKISAEEVELLLLKHESIVDVAIVAMPDERLGERACAFLVAAEEPIDLAQVRAHLEELGLAKFKWPERLEWVDALPRTPIGKLNKKQLAARARAAAEEVAHA